MILLSNGGTNIQRAASPSDKSLVGTVDGVALLERAERGWTVKHRALQGVFVSAVTALEDGTLFAATRGVGVARSDDGGMQVDLDQRGPGASRVLVVRAPASCKAARWCSSARCRRIFTSARTRASPGAS